MLPCIAPRCTRPRQSPQQPFCATCAQAPAPRRGGWLSAYRRKRMMADDHPLASKIRGSAAFEVDGEEPKKKKGK